MTDAQDERGKSPQTNPSADRPWMVTVIALALLLIITTAPTHVEGTPFSATPSKEIQINCPAAVMKKAPTFLSNPKGSATYPFEMNCTNAVGPGVLYLYFEGRWNPSETRQDMPNAVETLFIENYAPNFIPDRQQRGTGGDSRIFVYWTARCTADPWLQGGTCRRFGEYVPDDVRAAIPDIGLRPFPLTGNRISPSLKQQLIKQYQSVNQPRTEQQSVQSMIIQPQQSQVMTQSQRTQAMTVQPQAALPKPDTGVSALARSGIFARGVEEKEGQTSGQQEKAAQTESAETSDMAVLEEGTPEIAEPAFLTLDRPLHVMNAKGNAVELKPGIYEIGTIMDVLLGLAKEGQPTVLLHAKRAVHSESIKRIIALVIPGQSNDEQHVVLLTPDGTRFDAVGSASGVKSRNIDKVAALPDKKLTDAIIADSAKPAFLSSPSCQPNPAEIGPRWIPVPCAMPTVPTPAPTP